MEAYEAILRRKISEQKELQTDHNYCGQSDKQHKTKNNRIFKSRNTDVYNFCDNEAIVINDSIEEIRGSIESDTHSNASEKNNLVIDEPIVENSESCDNDVVYIDHSIEEISDPAKHDKEYNAKSTHSDSEKNIDASNESVPLESADSGFSEKTVQATEALNVDASIAKNSVPLQSADEKKIQATEALNSVLFGIERVIDRQLTYEMMPGFRFSSSVLYCPEEKQFYIRNSASKIGIGFTCYVNDCKARVHVRNSECFVGNSFSHEHVDKHQMYLDLCALNEMKRILRSPENRNTPLDVFDDVMTS